MVSGVAPLAFTANDPFMVKLVSKDEIYIAIERYAFIRPHTHLYGHIEDTRGFKIGRYVIVPSIFPFVKSVIVCVELPRIECNDSANFAQAQCYKYLEDFVMHHIPSEIPRKTLDMVPESEYTLKR